MNFQSKALRMNFNTTVLKLHLKTALFSHFATARLFLFALILCDLSLKTEAQPLEAILSTNLFEPSGIAIDASGSYYIADSANNRIVKFDVTTRASTVFSGAGGPANFGAVDGGHQEARFFDPESIVAVTNGFVVADTGNHLIRFVSAEGNVQTLAGDASLAQESIDAGLPPDTYGFKDGAGAAVQFNSPSAVAWDGKDLIYIADTQNDAVRKLRLSDRTVSTAATGFSGPTGVAVGRDGRVYVSDTGNNAIKIIETDGRVTLLAGGNSRFASGYTDNQNGTRALFAAPRGLFFVDSNFELLVADSGNAVIRRITDTRQAVRGVDTLVGPGAGLQNPVALARDDDGSIIIVDRAANAVKAFRGAGVQEQIAPPQISLVQLTNSPLCDLRFPERAGKLTSVTVEVITNSIYNNDVTIAIQPENAAGVDLGIQTFYTIGPTDPLRPVPDPTISDASPPQFFECQLGLPPSILFPIQPDTTIKAVSARADRRPSPVVTARVRFQVANPRIIGDNASSFTVQSSTTNAVLWYSSGPNEASTPDPTNGVPSLRYDGTSINLDQGTNNVFFKVRGFKPGYLPSAIVKNLFVRTNTVFTTLGAPYDLTAGVGASIALPVEVNLAPNDTIKTLQFRAEVTPLTGAEAPDISFVQASTNDLIVIAGSQFEFPAVVDSYQSGGAKGISLAYLGPTAMLINTQIETIAVLKLKIPPAARHGDQYSVSFRNISATLDAAQRQVDVMPLPPKIITISTNLSYIVGDSARAVGYNIGEFGDRNLNNNDVNNAFDAALGRRLPLSFSDAFNAMDAFPPDLPGHVGGDGIIRYLDWQTILHRSIQLDPTIWQRRWSEGGVLVPFTTNLNASPLVAAEILSPATQPTNVIWKRPALLRAANYPGAVPSHLIQVPVTMELRPGVKVSGFQFVAKVKPAGDQVPITSLIFNSSPGMPAPSRSESNGPDEIICAWNYDVFNPPLSGTNVIGNLIFSIPASAVNNQHYEISFAYADGSLGLETQIDFESLRGMVSVGSLTAPAEILPDEWKTYFFQDLANPLAQADLDPDGDGASNWIEYLDGTNPRASDLVIGRIIATNDIINFSWFASTGVKYFVETKPAIDSANWVATQAAITGSGGTLTTLITNTLHLPFQIFRLRANTQPTP
jgi:streptogramin lyase